MVGIGEIIKNSFYYPFQDWKNFLILGVLFVLTQLISFLNYFELDSESIFLIFILILIAFLVFLIIYGYQISIISETINYSNSIPDFDIGKNFVSGLKVMLIGIV